MAANSSGSTWAMVLWALSNIRFPLDMIRLTGPARTRMAARHAANGVVKAGWVQAQQRKDSPTRYGQPTATQRWRANLSCPGERQYGTLRFPVGFSTLNPKILSPVN